MTEKDIAQKLNNTPKSKFFYGYVVAAAGFLVWLISWGTYSTFGVFFKPVMDWFNWTSADTVLAYSMASVVTGALAIVMGWLTDKLGPKVVLMGFGSFLGISYLLMSQVSTLWHFQVNYALVAGIGLATATIPVMATVARWFVKRRALMTGIVQTGVGVGGLIFAPMAGWLITAHGWRWTYIILGIITIVGILIAGFLLKRDPRDIGLLPDGVKNLEPTSVKKQQASAKRTSFTVREAMRTNQFWLIAGLFFTFGFVRCTFLPHTGPYVQDVGFSLTDAANVTAALTLASNIGRLAMGRVADIIGNKKTEMLSYVASIISLAWGITTGSLWGLYLFAIIFGFGWGAQAVLRFSTTAEAFGLASLGLVMGVLGFAEASAAAIGSYLAGYWYDTYGSYQPAFISGIVVSVIGIILVAFLKPVKKTA